jgi:amino acid transporter
MANEGQTRLRRWLDGPWTMFVGLSTLTGWWALFVIVPIGVLMHFMKRWDHSTRDFMDGASLVGFIGVVWLIYVYENHTQVADRMRRLLTTLLIICLYLIVALYVTDPHRPPSFE